MALNTDASVWQPTKQASCASVGMDRCAADPKAPAKDWVYAGPAIGFVLSGWFDYRVEGRTAFAAPGAVVLGNAGEHFQVHHHDTNGNRRVFAMLPQALLDDVANAEQLDTPRFTTIAMPPSSSTTRMLGWLRAMKHGDTAQAEEAAYALAHAALRAPEPQRKRVSARNRARVHSVARYIDTNFATPCALTTLAETANVSRYELVRAFTAVMGQSPHQYLMNTRIRAAAEQLSTTATPIAEIALEVGFNDLSHFYACFRTAFGCTPLNWRTRH